MTRRAALALAGAVVAVAVAVITVVAVVVVSTVGDEGGAGTDGATDASAPATAPDAVRPGPAPPAPPVPAWGDFPGAPPELVAPVGGDTSTEAVPGGAELTVQRADGSTLAVAGFDPATGAYADARFFDRRGRLAVVVSAVREAPPTAPAAGSSRGARVRCGSPARVDAGYRWAAFPIGWRLNPRPLPARISRGAALGALRGARGVWNANRSHCRSLPDRSRARFSFAGLTGRRTARDGRNVIEFGETDRLGGICRSTVACTITWVVGRRAAESDARIDRLHAGGYFTGSRRRGLDLQSVMVHESGHTLGFAHAPSRDVAMFAFIGPRTVGGRILGRGDALANNAKY